MHFSSPSEDLADPFLFDLILLQILFSESPQHVF